MELEGSSKGSQSLILRCADDEGNFMCFICGEYAPSAETLYIHLKTSSCSYKWRSVLPNNLFDINTVVVRHTLLITPHSSMIKLKEGECSSSHSGGDSTTNVVADAPDSTNNAKDRSVVAEAVSKVVRDFDLNELPIMEELPDDQ